MNKKKEKEKKSQHETGGSGLQVGGTYRGGSNGGQSQRSLNNERGQLKPAFF